MEKRYRIINKGKGILNIALENLQRVGYDITAATTSLDPTNLTVAPEVELQAFTETIDKAVLRARGTGVSASYDASVAVGGTTFTLGDVEGEINGDQGFFNIDSAAESNVTVSNLTVGDTFVYIDNTGQRQQQTSEPTREDWVRKVFTMRIAVDTVSQTILGFEFLNNPIGHYSNSIRDIYETLIAQGVPFKEDQIVTGRASDLGFDISAGTLLEFGGTGDIYKPNTKDFPLVQNAPFFLSTRTAFDAGGNTALPKFWDNNGTLTPLGSTTLVGHRLYRFSNGNIAIQYGQGNYANMSLAKVGVRLEEYVLNPKLKNATLFGWWFIESTATNTGGTTLTDFVEYTLGIQGGSSNSLSGCLLKGNNLSDLLDVSLARTNLGAASTAQGVLADNSVQLTGAESISGRKTFTGGITISNASNRLVLTSTVSNLIEFNNSTARDAYFGRIIGAGIRTVNEIGGGQFTIKDDGTFDFNGNVGIGATTPTEKFTVNGRIKIGDNATLGNAILESTSGNGLIVRPEFNISDTTAVVLEVQNNAGAALVSFKESGNVGIGTTTPLAPLHILDGSGGKIYLQDSDASLGQLHEITSSTNNFQLGTRTSAGSFVDTFYQAIGSASGTNIQQWQILGVNRMTLNAIGLIVNGNTTATNFIGSGSQLTGVATSAQGVLADNSVQLTGETSQAIDGNLLVDGNFSAADGNFSSNVNAKSFLAPLITITANTTLSVANSTVIMNASGGSFTATLPLVTSVPVGKKYNIVIYSFTNSAIIQTSGSDQIRQTVGDTTTSRTNTDTKIINTGTYWQLIN